MIPRRAVCLALATVLVAAIWAPATAADRWTGSWAAPPQPAIPGTAATYENQTLRLIVHISAGGRRVRIVLSNLYGDAPLRVGAAHIARRTRGPEIDPAADRPLTFDGQASVEIPAHAEALSDPVRLAVPALSDLAISLYLPGRTEAATLHILAKQTSYVSTPGDASAAALPGAKPVRAWPFLRRLDVDGAAPRPALVLFGDSLVDGDGSTLDANARWGDALAARLQGAGFDIGVVNAGLIGNRLLRASPAAVPEVGDAFGPSGLARFAADALATPGVRWVVIRTGTNDLGFPGALTPDEPAVGVEALIAGLRQLTAQARRRGVGVIATTLPPFEGAKIAPGLHTPQKEAARQALNAWIRAAGGFDAVIDLDRLLADPSHPTRLNPALDSGDHVHPNDAGYRAMAEAAPLTVLRSRR